MYLNYDVLGIIISNINDVQTLYSLILTSKWFNKMCIERFQKCFEPLLIDDRYERPKIYHPITQSTIDRHDNHLLIQRSGYYKIIEDLIFNDTYADVGIEIDPEGQTEGEIWLNGQNVELKLHNNAPDKPYTFIRFKSKRGFTINLEELSFQWTGRNNVQNVEGIAIE